jgi:hypothetical protein
MDIKFYKTIDDNWNATRRRTDKRMMRRINEFERMICNVEELYGAVFYTICEEYIVQKDG